jgi:hypothetical protein
MECEPATKTLAYMKKGLKLARKSEFTYQKLWGMVSKGPALEI